MAVSEITPANVAAMVAAFRIANAPTPAQRDAARPVGPTPQSTASPPPAAAPHPSALDQAPTDILAMKALMTQALLDAVTPEAGDRAPLRRGLEAYAAMRSGAPAQWGAEADLHTLLTTARATLDRAYLDAAGGAPLAARLIAEAPAEPLFAVLDRRALFAVAAEPGDLFAPIERAGARRWLALLAERILLRLEAPATASGRVGVLASFIGHLDEAGPEERRSIEWIVQRAAAASARDRLAIVAGAAPFDDPEAANPLVATVRAALEAPRPPAGRLAEAAVAIAGLRDTPLLGTTCLTPEMLLVGLAAALRTIDRRRPQRGRTTSPRQAAPDEAPEPFLEEQADAEATAPTTSFEGDDVEDDEADGDDEEWAEDDGEDDFEPEIDR